MKNCTKCGATKPVAEYHKDKTGFFGFFECVNEPAVARALFEKAAEVLREAGLDTLRGPYNPSINDDCGVLLNGFEKQPVIGLPQWPQLLSMNLEEMMKDLSLVYLRETSKPW